ncbi:16S rRNA (cytidine(1402)-2'-O)-methyltransferase [Candidatus Uhrbacteria bacterium]|jgi:16S rRNA (cytidine1402-2'-O)-methyltransferase|nr:16S rRNA (cytidine(1402)-2'-O)-methyltransferase [Candidatus Uhrbacteria bacterium]MBT7717466.1 16S rRNA (cytidine(1402)-2'-O)-methyltransferase [Candidatus Uhrbacteria bacterium]
MQSKGTLYVVGTPIGNLSDITERALETLKTVDLIACEDTRVTKKLLSNYSIDTPTISYHQHSTDEKAGHIVSKLVDGASVALVTDAGTPGISDPGGKLVEVAIKADVTVVPIPGASAIAAALSVCGFPTDKFTFLGFPPNKKGRKTYFENIETIKQTVALYESKHRIIKTLEQLPQDRTLIVGRELTKMHEHIYRGTAPEVIEQLNQTSTKGEFVIVIAPR